jgi:membrane protein DedA with SNARE-associated domain
MEQQILDFINQVYQLLGWPGVVLLMAIESACIPLPSELIMPLAGWMLIESPGLSVWYIVLAGFCGAIGNVIGSLVAYAVGAWGGLPFLHRYGKYILISNHDLDRANRWFYKYGDWITFLSRLVPAVRTFISFPAGIARMPIGKFTLYAFIGSFIWSVALTWGGYILGQSWERIREIMRPFDYPIVGIIICLIVIFVWLRLRGRKNSTICPPKSDHSQTSK